MNIKITFLLIFGIYFFANGQSESENKKYGGIEIYFINNFQANKNSYIEFDKKELKKFKRKYNKNSTIPDSICQHYIDIKNSEIENEPFLNLTDIKYYSKSDNTIELTDSGKEKIKSLKPTNMSVFGKPFIIVVKGKKLNSGWFWTPYSSQWCGRISILIEDETESLKLNFGGCGNDMRNNNEYLKELTELKK
ncbi:MAG: hypothetical protein V3U92_19480 [Cellulophaga sp.]